MRHMELFKQRREKKGNSSCSSMAVSLFLISQTPSLHGYLDFATQDTISFAFSVASELVEGVLGKTRILKNFVLMDELVGRAEPSRTPLFRSDMKD